MSNAIVTEIGADVCPRCHKRVGKLDSTAFVLNDRGDMLSIHAGCINDTDEVLEYFSHGEKVREMQADWRWDDGEAA